MGGVVALLLSVFTLVEYNCENLFDFRHDSLKADTEFLPNSYRHWTPYRYWKKLHRVGQVIIACGERNGDGRFLLPDLVALTEVENDSVLFDLTHRSILRQSRYEYVMTSSSDERGIDVALLYSPFTFKLLHHHSIRVPLLKGMKPTRDILYAKGITVAYDTLHVFVVHAPSRSGGELETRPHRMQVANRLMESVDSVLRCSPLARILVAGDFNDTERDASVKMLVGRGLYDLSEGAVASHGAKGTYRYHGLWQNLDHILGSVSMRDDKKDAFLCDFEFLLKRDEKYGGVQPFRNYIGMRYQNGFSDHLPLMVRFELPGVD